MECISLRLLECYLRNLQHHLNKSESVSREPATKTSLSDLKGRLSNFEFNRVTYKLIWNVTKMGLSTLGTWATGNVARVTENVTWYHPNRTLLWWHRMTMEWLGISMK